MVVWTNDSAATVSGRFYDSSGLPLTGEITVNEVAAAPHESVGVCTFPGGAFLTAWESAAHPSRFYVRRFTTAGPDSSELGVDGGGASLVDNGKLGCDSAGDAVLAWRDFTGSMELGQRLDSAPSLVGSAFTIDTAPDAGAVIQNLVMAPTGWFLAQWVHPLPSGAPRARRYDVSGAPLAPSFNPHGLCCGGGVETTPPAAITSEGNILAMLGRTDQYPFVQGSAHDASPTPIGFRMVFADRRERREPRTLIAGADGDVMSILSHSSGGRLYGRLYDIAPLLCSPTALAGCYPVGKSSYVVSDLLLSSRDRSGWRATRVTGGPAVRGVLSAHVLCVYDHSAGIPSLVDTAGAGLFSPCGLLVDKSCWKVTANGGLRYASPAQKIAVDATRAVLNVRHSGSVPGPFSPTEYFDLDPKVIVQLSNPRGECWSTEYQAPLQNTAEIFRATE